MLEFHLTDLHASDRATLAEIIQRGGVGIIPTETVYGLFCLAGNEVGRERIYQMKEREARKPMQYLLSGLHQADQIKVDFNGISKRLAERFWPGPLTIVLTDREANLQGLRIPDHEFARQFIEELGSPVHATSANLSGTDPFESAKNGFADLTEKPDFIVWDAMIDRRASTVIKLSGCEVELLREGDIALNDIQSCLNL